MHHLFCELWRWRGSCERRSHHALTGGFMSIIWPVLPPLVAEVHRCLLTLLVPPAVPMPGSVRIWLLLNLHVQLHLRSELINIAADGSIGTGPWAVGFERSHSTHRSIGQTLSNILVILRRGLLRPPAVSTSQLLLKPLPKLCQLLRGCRILASNCFLCWHRNRRYSTALCFLRRLTGVGDCCEEPFLRSEKPWAMDAFRRNWLWFLLQKVIARSSHSSDFKTKKCSARSNRYWRFTFFVDFPTFQGVLVIIQDLVQLRHLLRCGLCRTDSLCHCVDCTQVYFKNW